MGKRIVGVLAALVLAVMGVAVSPSAAVAAKSDCPAANLCLWDSVNYAGTRWQYTIGFILQQPGDCLVLGSGPNNKASSIFLNGSLVGVDSLTLFDLNGGGANRGISSGGYSDANMLTSPGIANFSNVLSSICANT